MNMPVFVFYTSLMVGFLTTVAVSLFLSGKFAPLHLGRKLFIAATSLAASIVCSASSSRITATFFEYMGWPWRDDNALMLVPTRSYLRWMYTLEAIFVAVIISCLILAMARSERKPGLYLRR